MRAFLGDLFELDKPRPYFAKILYFLESVIILFFSSIMILPFSFEISDICFFSCLNIFKVTTLLNDTSLIVILTLLLYILYIISCLLRRKIIKYFVLKENYKTLSYLLTLIDLIDLVGSFFSSLFVFSVIIQYYHTGNLYLTWISGSIYFYIVLNAVQLIAYRYNYRNKKICKSIIEKEY